MSADQKAAREYAKLVQKGHSFSIHSVPALAAAFLEVTAALERERKAREEAPKWTCFHCGFSTAEKKEAEAHFGDGDGEVALCIHWSALQKEDRLLEYQAMIRELNFARDELVTAEQRAADLQARLDRIEAETIEKCAKVCYQNATNYRLMKKVAEGMASASCYEAIRALTSSPVAGEQTKSAAGQQTQLPSESENLSDVDVKVAPVAAHQADKAAAFEWLRALALGTTPDARPAALLLQEISELNGKVKAAGIMLRAYGKNVDKESAVTQKSDEKHQSELAEIRSRSGSYAPAVLASAADPYKECLIHHVYRCSTCHTQVPEFTFSKHGEHTVTNAAAADPTPPGLELAAKICEYHRRYTYETGDLPMSTAHGCDVDAIRTEIARRQQAKEAGK